jgi:kynurenine--oxoglutarate transaminase/cysteine-S-conjugate beta-lyase/glutamine--phenylpyruvate transaminase
MIRDIICLSGDKVNLEQETDELKDYRFTKWMSKNVKLQGIPPSAFYSKPHKSLVETSVRYCFIKVWKKYLSYS